MSGGMQSLSGVESGLHGSNAPAAPPVAGYVLWVNSQQGLYQDAAKTTPATANNDPVGAWADQSGNGHDITQSTSGNRPLLKTAQINSLPGILFDGTNDVLKASAFTLNQPETVFIVYQVTGFTQGDVVFDGNSADTMLYYQWNDPSNNTRMYAGNILTPLESTAAGNWLIFCGIFNNTSSQGRKNAGTAVTGTVGVSNAGGFTLGAEANIANWGNITVAEVIIYASALGTTDETSVRNYLNTRYAIF